MKMFEIDLKPYQTKHRAKVKQQRAQALADSQADIVAALRALDTAKHTLPELMDLIAFDGTERGLKAILVREKLPYKTKSWFAKELKKADTTGKTMRELYEECGLETEGVSLTTFRTRLHENAIPYKQIIKTRFGGQAWREQTNRFLKMPLTSCTSISKTTRSTQPNTQSKNSTATLTLICLTWLSST